MAARSFSAALGIALLCTELVVAYQQPPTAILPVDSVQIVQASATRPGQVEVTFHNSSRRPITAMGFSVEVRFADGTARLVGQTEDRFMTELTPQPGRAAIRPDDTASTTIGLQSSSASVPIVDVAVIPTAIIFVDGTAVGDERQIQTIFHRRELYRRVWEALDNALAGSKDLIDPRAALDSVDTIFESHMTAELRNTASYDEIRRKLALALAQPAKRAPADVLHDLYRDAPAQRALAAKHSQRRQ